ncbi:unnamed protein product, partial [marine sediment metagenome]
SEQRLPGENALVTRMLYEVVKKLGVHEQVALDRTIFFVADKTRPTGFRVRFLESVFAQIQGESETHPLDLPYPKDVLILRYSLRRDEGISALLAEQVAEWEIRRVTDRSEAEEIIRLYGQVKGYGRTKAAVLLADRKDLVRLQAAVAVRETVAVNDAATILTLRQFHVGRRIMIPKMDPLHERVFLVDYEVADNFFLSEFYYEVFQDTFRNHYEGIRELLDRKGR